MVITDDKGKKEEADKSGPKTIQEIVQELDKTGKYGEDDTVKLFDDAKKIYEKREAEAKKEYAKRIAAKIKAEEKAEREKLKEEEKTSRETKKSDEEKFDESVKDLKENIPSEWTQDRILNEFNTYPDLKIILFNVAVNQPTKNLMIRTSLGYEKSFEPQVGRQLKKLRRMGLLRERIVFEIWVKDYCNKKYKTKLKLTKEDLSILKKFSLKEETDERTRNILIGNTGFWLLTDLGKKIVSIAKANLQE